MSPHTSSSQSGDSILDVVVVGAGFSGIYLAYRLSRLGLSFCVLEKGNDVGGTWHWNRYPGARCDAPSIDYSYAFSDEVQQEWTWSERYASQPEILAYLRFVTDKFDLREHIVFKKEVTRASYEGETSTWRLVCSDGSEYRARFCVMATGCLSVPQIPDIPGLESFNGPIHHTGLWPEGGVDFSGISVGVIGTGSSGIQIIPMISRDARSVVVFQRTPNFSVPARNEPLDEPYVSDIKARYADYRLEALHTVNGIPGTHNPKRTFDVSTEERRAEYERRWQDGGAAMIRAFSDVLFDERANDSLAEFVRSKIREAVEDPDTQDALLPLDHPIGTKRICVDTDYFETFNRSNVRLVDVRRSPIECVIPDGIVTSDETIKLDLLVLATGFDAMTGALLSMEIAGRDGESLRDRWKDGPVTYLGIAVAGFPNLFTVTGPSSPSVLSNMVVSIEQHVNWIVDCISFMAANGQATIEATHEAEKAWLSHGNEVAAATLFPTTRSWYTGANIPGKPRVFMVYVGGIDRYRMICDRVAESDYAGFMLDGGPPSKTLSQADFEDLFQVTEEE